MNRTYVAAFLVVAIALMKLPAAIAAPAAALGAFLVIRWMPRLGNVDVHRSIERSTSELPLVLDTMALVLDSGVGWDRVVRIAAMGCSEPLASELSLAANRLAMGATADEVWTGSAALEVVQLAVDRSERSGSPVSRLLCQRADEIRSQRRLDRLKRARRVGTVVLLPLTLLGIPGFMLLGVIPAVVTLFQATFSGVFSTVLG